MHCKTALNTSDVSSGGEGYSEGNIWSVLQVSRSCQIRLHNAWSPVTLTVSNHASRTLIWKILLTKSATLLAFLLPLCVHWQRRWIRLNNNSGDKSYLLLIERKATAEVKPLAGFCFSFIPPYGFYISVLLFVVYVRVFFVLYGDECVSPPLVTVILLDCVCNYCVIYCTRIACFE